MDEGSGREEIARANLARIENDLRLWPSRELVMLRGLAASIERDFRWLRRHKWIMRGCVLLNICIGCWLLSSWPKWVASGALFSASGAWYAFRKAEETADHIARLQTRWDVVREHIKNLAGMANES